MIFSALIFVMPIAPACTIVCARIIGEELASTSRERRADCAAPGEAGDYLAVVLPLTSHGLSEFGHEEGEPAGCCSAPTSCGIDRNLRAV